LVDTSFRRDLRPARSAVRAWRWVATAAVIAAVSTGGAQARGGQTLVVNAGDDQVVAQPAVAELHGRVTSDELVTVRWQMVSGPGPVEFRDATAQDTEVALATAGTYVLRLNASDGASAAGDDVTIVVVAATQAPTVSAGPDQTIAISDTATLDGAVADDGPDARLRFAWTLLGGPGTVTMPDAATLRARATFGAAGTYVLRLTVSDGATAASDDVTITVTAVNGRPRVSAGPDRSVALLSSALLAGTASDDGAAAPPGLLVLWSVVKGPGAVTFESPSTAATAVRFAVAGTYVLRLTASDGLLQAHDDVTVVAVPPPAATALMAAYGFDEGAGMTVPDRSGRDVTLTRHGARWEAAGRHHGAMAFDGVRDRLEGAPVTLPATFTMMAWLLDPSEMPFETLIAVGAGRAMKLLSREISFTTPEGDLAFGPAGSPGMWHHVAVTCDGATVRAFLDGVALGQPHPAALEPFTGPLQVGAWPLGAPVDFLGGWLDDVRIYGRALSAAEIARDMATPIGGRRAPDTDAPQVRIDAIADGDTLDEVVTIGAVAADDVGVVGVRFLVDGVALGTEVTAPPYWASWDTRTVANGEHALQAAARDTAGNVAHSATVTVTVTNPRQRAANRAPTVSAGFDISVTSPTPALLQGAVTDDGLPSSPGAVTMTWSVVSGPGEPVFERPHAPDTLVRFPGPGAYVLRLTASDGALAASDDVTVTVGPPGGG